MQTGITILHSGANALLMDKAGCCSHSSELKTPVEVKDEKRRAAAHILKDARFRTAVFKIFKWTTGRNHYEHHGKHLAAQPHLFSNCAKNACDNFAAFNLPVQQ
jgi:hypothetical protein